MDKRYNLYNPEPQFKKYLVAGNIKPSTLKNYLSDFRHFFGWLVFYLKSQNGKTLKVKALETSGVEQPDKKLFNLLITPNVVAEYKDYLVENNLPLKTINRRLSTIRKFCSFCISQGWMKENPAKKVKNVIKHTEPRDKKQITQILEQFKQDLNKQNLDQQQVKSCLSDAEDFLSVLPDL